MKCLTCRDIGSSGRVGDDMNWMEIQTLSLCFIVLILKEMRFCLVRSLPDYVRVYRTLLWNILMKMLLLEEKPSSSNMFSVLYSIFERMDAAVYNGSEGGIFEQFICFAGVSEYTDRYYSICVWCMSHSVMSFLRIFRGLSCMSQPQVKEDQMLSLKSLSWLRYHGKLAFA